jgi:polysaccharide biosynthesis/export protein
VVRFAGSLVRLCVAGLLIGLGGCAGQMPTSGPLGYDVKAGKPLTPDGLPYGFVRLTPQAVATLIKYEPKGLAGSFTDRRPPAEIKFGVGDVLSVTIFEAAAGGLFIPAEAGVRPGNYVTLPDQAIDNNGNINVPYAGAIKAAGRTAVQVEQDIVARIKNRAIEPQVVVAESQQRTSLISVLGEVNTPVRYPAAASGAGDRILDAITRAGGIKGQGFETWVMLERHGKHATVPFENLVMTPSNNIYVQPGDRIYVYREQQQFIALGATGQSGEFNFDAWRINLAEAVGKAGGLLDDRADPGAVFLYRVEPRDVAEDLGVDVAKFQGAATIPVIFSVNFRDPGSFFLATKVQMKNDDIIYVSNANSVEVTKFLLYLQTIMATVDTGVNTANDSIILRNNIKALH